MSTDSSWITTLIAKARKHHPSMPGAVSTRIEGLLDGQLSERQLTPAELKSAAAALIADTVPVPPKAKQ